MKDIEMLVNFFSFWVLDLEFYCYIFHFPILMITKLRWFHSFKWYIFIYFKICRVALKCKMPPLGHHKCAHLNCFIRVVCYNYIFLMHSDLCSLEISFQKRLNFATINTVKHLYGDTNTSTRVGPHIHAL